MTETNVRIKKNTRKVGRTIIVRNTKLTELQTSNLIGLLSCTSINDGKYFLTFDNINNSKKAFITLRTNKDLNVKYAYYKIFFTMSGIDEKQDYTELKKLHSEWITQNSSAEVLYYKQYMKDSKYMGCGDFTVDTKESMDKLISKEDLKNYTFGLFSGSYYRYNKQPSVKQTDQLPEIV